MHANPDSENIIIRALNPAHSVVVEACAGSGKTWLLASRIVRLLLAGFAPGEILAITFTRKAAREIEERVLSWLQFLASAEEAQLKVFLLERGVQLNAQNTANTLHIARGLYERVLLAQPSLAVNTFHGWFLQLLASAPLSANLAGSTLVEASSRLFDEIWQLFAKRLQQAPDSPLTRAFVSLLDEPGLEATRLLMRRALNRRSEWYLLGAELAKASRHAPNASATSIAESLSAALRAQFKLPDLEANEAPNEAPPDPSEAFLARVHTDLGPDFQAYLGLLELSELAGDKKIVEQLRQVLQAHCWQNQAAECFELLRSAFLTTTNTLRARKLSKASEKRFGLAGVERLDALHQQLGGAVLACLEQQLATKICAFNRAALLVFEAFLAQFEAFKNDRRQIDFSDAEWQVLKLLRDDENAAFLQARLDARYKHVLLDEFQDTSPLQWQILLAWFAAYSDDTRPRVFLVGDPKQSIYRFRQAEPKLFAVAADFLQTQFQAERCEQDSTRRNARPIIDVVNALFLAQAEFVPFREQHSLADSLPGRVALFPLFGLGDSEQDSAVDPEKNSTVEAQIPTTNALRNPLIEADFVEQDLRLQQEADNLAQQINNIVHGNGNEPAWLIDERGADGRTQRRPAVYGDFMLLVRARTHLAIYERALIAANIPFAAGSRGGLLLAPETLDITALLGFLVSPMDKLKLAHVLRSPIFACTDEDLIFLAQQSRSQPDISWWTVLQNCATAATTAPLEIGSPRLQRAARLLSYWQEAADLLPVHDLLDQVFHQGEVLARYQLALPSAAYPSALANLRALLLLALEQDGGRYPSLPRFINELNKLRSSDLSEAPNEGAIESSSLSAGRVRMLTIHGAKGLEAPIVWLLGANASPTRADTWNTLTTWPPGASAPQHFSFYGKKEQRGTAREGLFELEDAAAKREELNLLYVAITRARQVFMASGIALKTKQGQTAYELLARALSQLNENNPEKQIYGDDFGALKIKPSESLSQAKLAVPDQTEPQTQPQTQKTGLAEAFPPIGERLNASKTDAEPPSLNIQNAQRFGILLHAILERRTVALPAPPNWWLALDFSDAEYERALCVAERLLSAPNLQRFFDPTRYRRAWNELEIGTPEGLQRIDRLVELPAKHPSKHASKNSELWVLDYKSSLHPNQRVDDYAMQVSAYCQAIAQVFPQHEVRGALIFADASLHEVG